MQNHWASSRTMSPLVVNFMYFLMLYKWTFDHKKLLFSINPGRRGPNSYSWEDYVCFDISYRYDLTVFRITSQPSLINSRTLSFLTIHFTSRTHTRSAFDMGLCRRGPILIGYDFYDIDAILYQYELTISSSHHLALHTSWRFRKFSLSAKGKISIGPREKSILTSSPCQHMEFEPGLWKFRTFRIQVYCHFFSPTRTHPDLFRQASSVSRSKHSRSFPLVLKLSTVSACAKPISMSIKNHEELLKSHAK